MGKLIQSYVHGVSALPLIGDTIGVHFDRAVARWPESEALVVRHQGVRWTYRELSRPKRARRYTECRLCSLPYGLAPKVTFFTAAPSDVRRGLPRRRSDKRHPAMPVVRPLAQKRRAQPGPGAKPHRLVRTAGEAKPRRTSGGGAASKSFAHYKIPRYIKFVDLFPMTVTGKVQKFAMRAQMIVELGLDEEKTA